IVPMFACGFVRANFSLAISLNLHDGMERKRREDRTAKLSARDSARRRERQEGVAVGSYARLGRYLAPRRKSQTMNAESLT
ncbi:hypothetical protein, partial [Marinicauda pacifica]|uniref:hypothetical protein n=1 Tax=Marinicauda pacifica TaxID=1133559 RepID=UPI0035C85F4C